MRALRGWMVSALVVGLLAGCAGSPTTSSTGEFIDDSTITTKIKSRLVADSTVSAYDISVETFRGVVVLSGFVNTDLQKERAVAIARSTGGVRGVKGDGLVIRPGR